MFYDKDYHHCEYCMMPKDEYIKANNKIKGYEDDSCKLYSNVYDEIYKLEERKEFYDFNIALRVCDENVGDFFKIPNRIEVLEYIFDVIKDCQSLDYLEPTP